MKNSAKKILIAFVLGMVLMFVLDMIFHFNNSVEKQLERETNKAGKKIENLFKK
ncbi:hypothetical protein ACUNWD_04380 [Sunxiuqinia sp. A32]|uniref:hypothetical protein n=1 Tax=Sunxiuqinia sp. A32 TaxID=3461496 RepID=UPI00404628A0